MEPYLGFGGWLPAEPFLRVLQSLRRDGRIRVLSKGRDAAWERVEP